jgi:hypothetical protein
MTPSCGENQREAEVGGEQMGEGQLPKVAGGEGYV